MILRRHPAAVTVLAVVAALAIAGAALVGASAAGVIGPLGPLGPLGPFAGSGPAVPRFVEEAAAAGLVQTYDGDARYYTGGGVAAFDCDDDGLPELYIAGGSNPAALFHNDTAAPGAALRFRRLPDAVTDLVGVTGAYPIDLDGDGITDLAVLRAGGLDVLRGLGGCRFELADERFGLAIDDGLVTAFSATWEPGASLPTLAVGRYLGLDPAGGVTHDCGTNLLVRPEAGTPPDGASSRYAAPIPLLPSYCTLSALFSDWSHSGRRDLRLSNDRNDYRDGSEQLWRIETGSAPRAYTTADGWRPLQLFGMGIAAQDVTGDGLPEYYLTSQGDNRLQTLASGPSQPSYSDLALARGVTSAQPFTGGEALPSTAWHPEFEDVNDDGLPDLFVSKGNVSAEPGFATRDPSDLFLGRRDGTFVEAADGAGLVSFDRGRGAALVDLNLDGLPDLVEVNLGAPVHLWRNVGSGSAATPAAMGHWLAIQLRQAGPNADGVGSWLEVTAGGRVGTHELTIGGGHASGELGYVHVGLGDATAATVRVQWPDGTASPPLTVAADRSVTIDRSGAVRTLETGQP